jgi:hypothetical protein
VWQIHHAKQVERRNQTDLALHHISDRVAFFLPIKSCQVFKQAGLPTGRPLIFQ